MTEKKEVQSHIQNAVDKILAGGTKLSLGNCQITDEDAITLANALKHGKCKLMELYLQDNQIGDKGARTLANALKNNEFLVWLYMDNNRIGDDGAIALADVLKSGEAPCKLVELYLYNNQISKRVKKLITDIGKTKDINIKV